MPNKLISIVIPSYNEEKNIDLIYEEIPKNIDSRHYDYEIIFVNDGSKDDTWGRITAIAQKDPRVRGLNFSRNFGHPAALQAGLEAAKGDAVIMMDGDLQHPPALIPALLKEWEAGYEIVNTVRKSTEKIGLIKRITSRGFYACMNAVSDLKLNDGEADFRLIDRRALNTLNALPESPKFYRGLVNWVGYKVKRVPYAAVARRHGTSSFTMRKMIELARLGLTSFSLKPLKLIIGVGLGLAGFSLVGMLALIIVKFLVDPLLVSYGSILVMMLIFITGLLATFQGIVAIYLVDIFNVSKGRPTFIIGETTPDAKK